MKEQNNNNQAVVTETMDGNLVVVREPILGKDGKQMITKDGRPYFAYVVHGVVKGREIKVDFCPKDQGGYEPLDILYRVKIAGWIEVICMRQNTFLLTPSCLSEIFAK